MELLALLTDKVLGSRGNNAPVAHHSEACLRYSLVEAVKNASSVAFVRHIRVLSTDIWNVSQITA